MVRITLEISEDSVSNTEIKELVLKVSEQVSQFKQAVKVATDKIAAKIAKLVANQGGISPEDQQAFNDIVADLEKMGTTEEVVVTSV